MNILFEHQNTQATTENESGQIWLLKHNKLIEGVHRAEEMFRLGECNYASRQKQHLSFLRTAVGYMLSTAFVSSRQA